MSEEQIIQEPIFEDLYHKEMWNNIVEEIKKMECGKQIKFGNFINLKLHHYDRLNYEGKIPINYCFACEYAKQFDDTCNNCPFEGINIKQSCLNGIRNIVDDNIQLLLNNCLDKQEFNELKQKCIEYAEQIRDWKIRRSVLCRSNIK